MIIPSARGLAAGAALLIFILALSFLGIHIAVLGPALLLPLIMVDIILVIRNRRFSFQLQEETWIIGRPACLELAISHSPGKKQRRNPGGKLQIRLILPESWETEEEVFTLPVENSLIGKSISIFPRIRGEFTLDVLCYRYRSPLGLIEIQRTAPLEKTFTVIPDLREMKKYLRLQRKLMKESWGAAGSRAAQTGEFDFLREYQLGDDATKIDWISSTRLQQPLVKTYKPESSGWVTIILDAGRWMNGQTENLSHFDRTLNALVALSSLIFAGGDYLRIMVAADTILEDRVFTPRKSDRARFSRFISSLKTREWDLNMMACIRELQVKEHRMSTLIIITQFLMMGENTEFLDHLQMLSRKCPVMLTLLRDPVLDLRSSRPMEPGKEFTFAAASDLKAKRSEDIKKMKTRGPIILDVQPKEIAPSLIYGFKKIK